MSGNAVNSTIRSDTTSGRKKDRNSLRGIVPISSPIVLYCVATVCSLGRQHTRFAFSSSLFLFLSPAGFRNPLKQDQILTETETL